MDKDEKERIELVWSEIPYHVRERMKMPHVLKARGADADEVKPKFKLRKTDRATPKERLGYAASQPHGGAPMLVVPRETPPEPTPNEADNTEWWNEL